MTFITNLPLSLVAKAFTEVVDKSKLALFDSQWLANRPSFAPTCISIAITHPQLHS